MKKLVIFLIPLVISISAFCQDKSSFTGNFSLVRYSDADNSEVFKIDIFSKRIPLSRISIVENRNQKWGNRCNLIYEKQEDINAEKTSESLAESYLRRLAERNRKSRKIGGIVGLTLGGASLGLGVWMMSLAEESYEEGSIWAKAFGVMFIASGAVGVGGSIYALAIPSRAERELEDVLNISDPGQRERASHEALSSLAAKGKKMRIITAAAVVASAVALIVIEKDAYPGAVYNGLLFAAPILLIKTRAERTYKNYLREKEYRKELALRVGTGPYGGVKIGFVYSY